MAAIVDEHEAVAENWMPRQIAEGLTDENFYWMMNDIVQESNPEALGLLHDACLEMNGMNMFALDEGRTYMIQTPIWYFIGQIEQITPAVIKFKEGGVQVHNFSDFTATLGSGRFPSGSEYTPVPLPVRIPTMMIVMAFDWPHAIPAAQQQVAS